MDSLLQQAVSTRPDLAAKFADVRAREAELDRARADYLPKLSANGSLGRVYRELDSLNLGPNGTTFYPQRTTWSVGLQLSWELFDGFIRDNRVREAKARRDQVTDYLMAFATADFKQLGEVMIAMGSVEGTVDKDALAKDLEVAYAPMLGSGYGAYWTGPVPSSPSYTFLGRMYFYPSQSHNGYLEVVNDLGFVGLICLLGYLVSWVRQSLQLMKFDRGQGLLYLALFFQQAITNLSESTWFAINSAFAIAVATLATFSLSRSLVEQRLKQHFRPSD